MVKKITRLLALLLFGFFIVISLFLILSGKNLSLGEWFTLAIAIGYYILEYMTYKEKKKNAQ
jgi:hypothetical protein